MTCSAGAATADTAAGFAFTFAICHLPDIARLYVHPLNILEFWDVLGVLGPGIALPQMHAKAVGTAPAPGIIAEACSCFSAMAKPQHSLNS